MISFKKLSYKKIQRTILIYVFISLITTDFITDRQLLETGDNVFQDYIATCKLTTLTYNPNNVYKQHATVTRDFAVDVCNLPTDEDTTNIDEYFQFLDTWGTVCVFSLNE